jgi:hypothetical protein
MRRAFLSIIIAIAAVVPETAVVPATAFAQVNVNVTVVPPPIIFPAPPRVVAVPNMPVYYVPYTSYNVFFYQGRYYGFHDGAWFVTPSHAGPWVLVPPQWVPQPLLVVPARYYKVPPGHAKKRYGEHGKGCPPGLAKQGRC